jgi:hypothetical protein
MSGRISSDNEEIVVGGKRTVFRAISAVLGCPRLEAPAALGVKQLHVSVMFGQRSYPKVAHPMPQSLGVVVKYAIHSSKFFFLRCDSVEIGTLVDQLVLRRR